MISRRSQKSREQAPARDFGFKVTKTQFRLCRRRSLSRGVSGCGCAFVLVGGTRRGKAALEKRREAPGVNGSRVKEWTL